MMDDKEMIYLQKKDCASCAVWEWIKSECWKRTRPDMRELSPIEKLGVAEGLGLFDEEGNGDVERFDAIVARIKGDVKWLGEDNMIRGWEKWQSVTNKVEDAARKRVEYWEARTEEYETPEIPQPLDTGEFKMAWEEYEKYRRQNGWKKLKPMSVTRLWNDMVSWGGADVAIAAIQQTITKGWQGIFQPKDVSGGKMTTKQTSYAGKLWALETHKKALSEELTSLRDFGGPSKAEERKEIARKIRDIGKKIGSLEPDV